MGKPGAEIYRRFAKEYQKTNGTLGKKQYLVPYLMSSHPGSTLREAIELAEFLRELGYMPQQVQDFYPTPSTISTCMYYTGLDPRTMEKLYVAHNPHEKAMQRALIQYRDPKNYELVKEALIKAKRTDLIGFAPECLIPPRKISGKEHNKGTIGKKSPKGTSDKRASKKTIGKIQPGKTPDNIRGKRQKRGNRKKGK